MKAIYSFNDKPFLQKAFDNKITYGGFESIEYFIESCKLSVGLARLNFNPIELYADKKSVLILKDILDIFDSVIETEEVDEKYNYYFSCVKFNAYRLQKEPFAHLDFDFYLYDKLSDIVLNNDLICDRKEVDQHYKVSLFNYVTNSKNPDYRLKKFLESGCPTTVAFNTGIFMCNNMVFLKEYIELFTQMIEENRLKTIKQICFIEQGMVAILAHHYKMKTFFLDKSEFKYIHLIEKEKLEFEKIINNNYELPTKVRQYAWLASNLQSGFRFS